jgi:hypothetical protein
MFLTFMLYDALRVPKNPVGAHHARFVPGIPTSIVKPATMRHRQTKIDTLSLGQSILPKSSIHICSLNKKWIAAAVPMLLLTLRSECPQTGLANLIVQHHYFRSLSSCCHMAKLQFVQSFLEFKNEVTKVLEVGGMHKKSSRIANTWSKCTLANVDLSYSAEYVKYQFKLPTSSKLLRSIDFGQEVIQHYNFPPCFT